MTAHDPTVRRIRARPDTRAYGMGLGVILASARRLERIGCRAIVAECGYFAWFQREIPAAVRVPVFRSSLPQAPLARAVVGEAQTVGVLVASQEYLRDRHLTDVGVTLETNYVAARCDGRRPGARFPFAVERGCAAGRSRLPTTPARIATSSRWRPGSRQRTPRWGRWCSSAPASLPSRAVQRAIDLPVFSWSTLMDYAYSVVAHRGFAGHV